MSPNDLNPNDLEHSARHAVQQVMETLNQWVASGALRRDQILLPEQIRFVAVGVGEPVQTIDCRPYFADAAVVSTDKAG